MGISVRGAALPHIGETGTDETGDRWEAVRRDARTARWLAATLRAEAQAACQVARDIVDDSKAVIHVSIGLRGGVFTRRCAWCRRYWIGDRWTTVSRSRLVLEDRTTHGICNDCTTAVREAEQSV